jgi:gas vesicle protein
LVYSVSFNSFCGNLVSNKNNKMVMSDKDEVISAFAFKVGRELEKLSEERNKNLQTQLEQLQTSVFRFRKEIESNQNMLRHFDLIFGIKEVR